ncbi:MAG: hypothetical protein MOP51_489 [Citricoccus sp.]|nr:hypothetical protein [Citricoccus sp. WCRC_4]
MTGEDPRRGGVGWAGADVVPEDLANDRCSTVDTRREAKRLRFAVKAVQDATGLAWGASFVDRMTTAKKLQQALGEHRDSLMFQDHVQATAKEAAKTGEDTFGYGVLHGVEFALQQQTAHDAEELLERLAGAS